MSQQTKETEIAFKSTKTYPHSIGLSACFRQWKAESHCKYLHGYTFEIVLTFGAKELDYRNWVVDFGSLKTLKAQLEDMFDHKTVVAIDDPEIETFRQLNKQGIIQLREMEAVGCEKFAEAIFRLTECWLEYNGYAQDGRCWIESVQVKEHGANSAIVERAKCN